MNVKCIRFYFVSLVYFAFLAGLAFAWAPPSQAASDQNNETCALDLSSPYTRLTVEAAGAGLLTAEKILATARQDRPTNPLTDSSLDGADAQFSRGFTELVQQPSIIATWPQIQQSLLAVAARQSRTQQQQKGASEETANILKFRLLTKIKFTRTKNVRIFMSSSPELRLLAISSRPTENNSYVFADPLRGEEKREVIGFSPQVKQHARGDFWIASFNAAIRSIEIVRPSRVGVAARVQLDKSKFDRGVGPSFSLASLPDGRLILAIVYPSWLQVFLLHDEGGYRLLGEERFIGGIVGLVGIAESPTSTFFVVQRAHGPMAIRKFWNDSFVALPDIKENFDREPVTRLLAMPDDSLLVATTSVNNRFTVFSVNEEKYSKHLINFDLGAFFSIESTSWHLTPDGRALMAGTLFSASHIHIWEPLKQPQPLVTGPSPDINSPLTWLSFPDGKLAVTGCPKESPAYIFSEAAQWLVQLPMSCESVAPAWTRGADNQVIWAGAGTDNDIHVFSLKSESERGDR